MVAGALLIYAVVTLLQQESTIDFDKYSITTTPSRIAVFYNVFALSDNVEYVKTIVKEQMSLLLPEHEFFVRSIGIPFNIPKTSLLKHDKEGDEAETLQLLWQHCNEHPNEKTVHIHSKGSLHNSDANNKLRRFLTQGLFQRNVRSYRIRVMYVPLACHLCQIHTHQVICGWLGVNT